MSGFDNFDRRLSAWLEADALPAAPAGNLERSLEVTRRRRPRPAWMAGLGSHWVGEAPAVGSGSATRAMPSLRVALVAVLAIAALAGGAILFGGRLLQPLPALVPSPTLPSLVPSPTLPSHVTPSPFLPSPTPLPPLNGPSHLAYGLDGSIYVANWDGSDPIRIANGVFDPGGAGPAGCGSFMGEGPMWSPDGRYLAYRSAWYDTCLGTPGADKVYVSDPEGHLVTSFPGSGWKVAWSPDSTRVATWISLGTIIGIFGLDGTLQTGLTVPEGCRLPGDFDPRWSPDGMSLVVWPCDIPVDGGTPSPFPTNDPRSNPHWAYSPDGALVAYIAYIQGNGRLHLAAANGSNDRVLAPDASSPTWSPTSDRIAFVASDSGARDVLQVIDVASGTVMSLTAGSAKSHLGVVGFSPDGDRILFSKSDANYVGTGLWSVRADGSDPQLLVAGTDWGDWQPVLTSR